MPDFDILLRRLGEEPVPEALGAAEDAVLQRVHGFSFDREPLRFRVAVVGAALLMGVAGGMLPEAGAARERVGPLGEAAELAPSTLLVGDR